MTTITKGATVLTPDIVEGLEESQDAATIEHVTLTGASLFTSRPDGPRSGTLRFYFHAETDLEAARATLAAPGPAYLDTPARPTWAMTFVRDGAMSAKLDDRTHNTWILEVGFREVVT